MLGVLNNISSIYAQNNLDQSQMSLSTVLDQLSSGSRINSGSDDAAGLSLADGLEANTTELTQSSQNASQGVGFLQTADGALAQVNTLLNRAVTLATETSNGTLSTAQDAAANQEYQSILGEINNIGTNTTYNGVSVFGAVGGISVFTDGSTDVLSVHSLTSSAVGDANGTLTYTASTSTFSYTSSTAPADEQDLSTTSLTTSANAITSLGDINSAITDVAAERGYIGSQVNLLNATSNVMTTESTNLTSAENDVTATDYSSATSQLSKYEILMQTGISALAQANSTQQLVTKLLQ
jgi:flagellin